MTRYTRPAGGEQEIAIPSGHVQLPGTLALPAESRGVVVFAHGSGSSRLSPRNRFVAGALFEAGIGTLLFDLLTPDEDRRYATRFDIALLSARLDGATRWLRSMAGMHALPLAYFGASTGAAATLVVASAPDSGVAAVVSRGGRPDLAGADALSRVRAPTLLIVGGEDRDVIALNREAYACLRCEKALRIIPDATHLFEEPGTLEAVAMLAAEWFRRWLAPARDLPG